MQLPEWSAWLSGVAAAAVEPQGPLQRFVADLALRFGVDPADLAAAAPQQLQQIAAVVADRTFRILSGLGGWVLQAGVAVFTLFYLLRDADGFVGAFKWSLPLKPAEADELLRRSREVIYATIYGTVVIAVVQGLLGGLIFWVLDVPGPAFWGLMMGLLALLPVIGPPIVWLPAGVALLFTGEIAEGLILLLLGAVVISGIDNVIRPMIVGGRAQLHPLVVFFSVLGGIAVFGALGIFVGPVVFAAALTFVEMARMVTLPEGDRRRMQGMLLRGGLEPHPVRARHWVRGAAAHVPDGSRAPGEESTS